MVKVVVLGASGMIGARLLARLRASGVFVVPASRAYGVDAVTGRGLDAVLDGADVVVDVMNAGDYDPDVALAFFETSSRTVLEAAMGAGVRHHIALSIVGADRMPYSGYFRAKQRQEAMIRSTALPHTIVRSTQFFEFAPRIVEAAGPGMALRLAPALIRPIAANDAAEILARLALAEPRGVVEIAGPRLLHLDGFVRDYLAVTADDRSVITDWRSRYFGSWVNDEVLVPEAPYAFGALDFEDWLRLQAASA